VYGAYDVVEKLDSGGCGTVFRCRHQHLQREAAVKVVVLSESNPLAEAHFVREVEVVRQFGHDRIATIFDSGVLDHGSITVGWLAMEYLPGGRIDRYIAHTHASEKQVLLLFRSIVATLLDAHQSGILHHDIKPANILMSQDGQPHLTDFGLARIAGSPNSLPGPDGPAGTPGYMAPELKCRKPVPSVTSEIYSLGVLLATLLNRKPGTTHPTAQTSAGTGYTPDRNLSRFQSRDLDAVLCRMTAAEPADRYSSLAQLLSEIDCVIDGRIVAARRVSLVERGYRWLRRNPSMAVLGAFAAATVAVAIVLFAVNLTSHYRHAREIGERNRELVAREEQMERATVSSRLRSIQTLLEHNRTLARQELEDDSLFPPPLRGFAWNYLRAETTVAVNDLSDLDGGFGGIYQVKFSPDNSKLAVCSKPRSLSIIDISKRTRTSLSQDIRLGGTVLSHPGQDTLFCQQFDGSLLEVSWDSGEVIRSIELPMNMRARMALTSLCDRIYGLTRDGRPFELQLESETINIGTESIEGVPAGLWLTPDDQILHCVTRQGIWYSWNADSLAKAHQDNVLDFVPLKFSQSHLSDVTIRAAQASYEMDFGMCIVLGFDNGVSTAVWPDANRRHSVIARSSLLTNHFAFRPRSQCVIPDGKGGLLFSVFDSHDQESVGLVTDSVIAAAVSPDNQWIATGGSNGKLFARRISGTSEQIRQLTTFSGKDLGFGPPVRAVQLRSSGETLICHREGWCAVINGATNQLLEGFQISDSQFSTVAYSPEHQLAVLGFRNPASRIVGLRVLDNGRFCTQDSLPDQVTESPSDIGRCPKTVFEIECDANVTSMCFAKNAEQLLVALRNGSLLTVDVASGQVVHRWSQFQESSAVLSMSAVEEGILCGAADGLIYLLDVRDGTIKTSWQAGDSRMYSLATSNDETQVIAGMASGMIRVFDRQGTLIRQMAGHQGRVVSLALSSDGETLASGGADHTIVIWDAHAGDMQLLLKRHTDTVTDLRFAANDSELWSTSADGAVYVWHTEDRPDDSPPTSVSE
jgi:WD40 repeat protein